MKSIKELEVAYIEKHPKSRELYLRALNVYPSGITHDGRNAKPFPIYSNRVKGTKRWDVDKNQYIDYVMGHGSMLFGYGDERIISALQEQVPKAIHMGTCTELEIEWAEFIRELVPNAKDGFVRPTSSGSEAVQLAMRLARTFTGRDKIVVHAGSYHGTGDSTLLAHAGPPFGMTNVKGITKNTKNDVIIIPYNDLKKVKEIFDSNEVACIIMQGDALYSVDYLKGLRSLTKKYGVVFILDEVVSGFRFSSGGAQEYFGVIPDITTLGKIIGGGAPVGAICGKKEIMEIFAFKDEYWDRFIRIKAGGTWNAQPLSIVGGIEMMKIIKEEKKDIYKRLYDIGNRIVNSFNQISYDLNIPIITYGAPTDNPTRVWIDTLTSYPPKEKKYLWHTGPASFEDYDLKTKLQDNSVKYPIYLSCINGGVYIRPNLTKHLCINYSDEELEKTENVFSKSLEYCSH